MIGHDLPLAAKAGDFLVGQRFCHTLSQPPEVTMAQ